MESIDLQVFFNFRTKQVWRYLGWSEILRKHTPGNLSEEPILSVVADTNGINQVCVGIQFTVSFPQAVLSKPAKTVII